MMDVGAAMFFTDYSMGAGELAQALEARGFESIWAPEHSHIPTSRRSPFAAGGELPKQYYDVRAPSVTRPAAPAVTNRIKLGTGVCLVTQRDPIQTAKLVASLDQVSNGRFLFGIGGGWNAEEMEDHGTVFKTRFKLMRERVEAMKAIWTQEAAEYHGELVDFGPMAAWPKPVQKPHPPALSRGGRPARITTGCAAIRIRGSPASSSACRRSRPTRHCRRSTAGPSWSGGSRAEGA